MTKRDYGAADIKVLEGLTAVRKRPAMYIGNTSFEGLHHLVYEVVDNSIDEAMVGFCDHIDIQILADDSVIIVDNGRGIPVGMHKTEKTPALEVVMTKLHSGGKFDNKSYKVSGGLHGVGVSVVNALSEFLEVEVYLDGYIYFQRFERGDKKTDLEKKGKTKRGGTKIHFKPDLDIFENTHFDFDTLAIRLDPNANLTYETDFDLGDVVTIQIPDFGLQFNQRITEVKEKYTAGQPAKFDLNFGIKFKSLYQNILQNKSNINNLEVV